VGDEFLEGLVSDIAWDEAVVEGVEGVGIAGGGEFGQEGFGEVVVDVDVLDRGECGEFGPGESGGGGQEEED